MKISILSCFYPYRGGISQFNAFLYGELGRRHDVKAFNFSRQYPEFLFPGKTQYVTADDEAVKIDSERLLDTANPFSYVSTLKRIREWGPDLLIIRYWMSWFAPSLGYVARGMKGRCKVISILDNVVPHEPRFFDKPFTKGVDSYLRWSYRQKDNSAFVFINNYERLQKLSAKKGVRFDVCGVKFPRKAMTIPAGTACIFPVNIDGIRYATAQIIAKRDGKIYMEQVKGIPTEIAIDGKVLRNVKPLGVEKPVYKNIYLLTPADAELLFLEEKDMPKTPAVSPAQFRKVKEAGPLREITIGVAGVAESPVDADFDQAAVYTIDVPAREGLLRIKYQGDCARLYANGKLIGDNFYNGREFLYGLWRLPEDVKQLELRILPMQPDEPVYFPREADITPGEKVISCEVCK